jgi:GntR family transcriptional regulator of vanillate catabolism
VIRPVPAALVRRIREVTCFAGRTRFGSEESFCHRFSIDEIVQAYEIRATLEGLCAKRAAQLGLNAEDRNIIDRALREGDELLQKEELSSDDCSIYGGINAAFHSAIHRAGQSRMLRDMLRVSQQVAPSSHRNVIAFEHRDVRRRHDDHHRIYESILYRDGGRGVIVALLTPKLHLHRPGNQPRGG